MSGYFKEISFQRRVTPSLLERGPGGEVVWGHAPRGAGAPGFLLQAHVRRMVLSTSIPACPAGLARSARTSQRQKSEAGKINFTFYTVTLVENLNHETIPTLLPDFFSYYAKGMALLL